MRKSVNIPDAVAAGTIIAGYGGQTLSLAQLQALLGVKATAPNTQVPTGGTPTPVVTSPTRISRAQAAGMFLGSGGDGGSGGSGPPGKRGKDGAVGAQGPAGTPGGPRGYPIALVGSPPDPRTPMLVRGRPGPTGPQGPAGSGGTTRLKLWLPSHHDGRTASIIGRARSQAAAAAVTYVPAIDTPPASPTAWDDEFTYGTVLDTTGARRAGANAWSYLSSNSSPVPTVANSWMRVNGSTTTTFCAKQAVPGSGAWSFTCKVIGPYASASYYSIALAILNNGISTNNLFQMTGYANILYMQEDSYNPSTGAFSYVNNGTTAALNTTAWYYLCVYYPGTGTTYYFYYSPIANQMTSPGLVVNPTEYVTTGPPAGFTLLTSVSLASVTHIALTETSTADVNYCDWFRRTL